MSLSKINEFPVSMETSGQTKEKNQALFNMTEGGGC